ncbi:MAG: hypothetical protein OEQ39_00240 [Gammaproteobacteria bacterium]|nr:hypothetical protein [Gammaproteobacteria bacterium]
MNKWLILAILTALAFFVWTLPVSAKADWSATILIGSHHTHWERGDLEPNEDNRGLLVCYSEFCAGRFRNSFDRDSNALFVQPEIKRWQYARLRVMLGYATGYDPLEVAGGGAMAAISLSIPLVKVFYTPRIGYAYGIHFERQRKKQ